MASARDWQRQMLRGGGLVVPAFTREQHTLIGKPPQVSRINEWREKLSDAEVRDFENYPLAHTLLARMGYQPHFAKPPRLSTLYVLGLYCHEFIHYVLHRLRHRRMEQRVVNVHRTSARERPLESVSLHQSEFSDSVELGRPNAFATNR